jgi:ABC-type uncharacterized transport system ATPase subunit|tara:strand:+ start:136 stop:609 length:474 start_codon:yes stop_codon:yes gene_type:complete
MGTQRAFEGRIRLEGRNIQNRRTEEIVQMGIVYVPEKRMLSKPLSAAENILMGAYVVGDKKQIKQNLEFVYTLFPRLCERQEQPVSTLSGGEQQMFAIGRGLMSRQAELSGRAQAGNSLKAIFFKPPFLEFEPIYSRPSSMVLNLRFDLKDRGITLL